MVSCGVGVLGMSVRLFWGSADQGARRDHCSPSMSVQFNKPSKNSGCRLVPLE